MLDITYAVATDTLSSFTYLYDQVGNRYQLVDYYQTLGGSPTVTVSVTDEYRSLLPDLPVYVFDGSSYTGHNDISDVNGEVVFDLPDGSYRFRADMNGVQFWSGTVNHCDVPGCSEATIVVTIPVTVTVEDTNGVSKEGVPVYAFDGSTYTGITSTSDVNGEAVLTLPQGDYRFRADYDGTQFWSGEVDHCTIPGCEAATVVVTLPVVVTVLDTDAVPQVGLPVYVFDDTVYTGFNDTTDGNGEVSFTLPQGEYRFRADLNGTQFWSDDINHCTIPGCEFASITVTIPVTVTVQSQTGSPYPDLPVYVFSGGSYTGYNGISDVNGQVVFTLPAGDYRFRADYDGVQFWSDEVDHCSIPSCLEAIVDIPGGTGEVNVTIDYTYDPLNRLTEADYTTGEYFWYTYDAVGNRLTQETHEGSNTYVYDDANRLIEVDGVTFIWDDNGNLIQDDVRIYHYDHANRLDFVSMGGDSYSFEYNGLGDRLSQTMNSIPTNYTLDLIVGLPEVLSEGTNIYLYGVNRISEQQPGGQQYHLTDALGSVRQLVDGSGTLAHVRGFEPFGGELAANTIVTSEFGFAGEWGDATGLMHLRARYYDSLSGRFISRDPVGFTENKYTYVANSPILATDPTGLFSKSEIARAFNQTDFNGVVSQFSRRGPYAPWGFLAALLYAESGDTLSTYNVKMVTKVPYRRELVRVTLTDDIHNGITANSLPLYQFFLQGLDYSAPEDALIFWRWHRANYYLLQGSSLHFFVDGSQEPEYPDFHSLVGSKEIGKAIIELGCNFQAKIGIGGGLGFIVDRFGGVYVTGIFGGGFGGSIAAYSEGYITRSAHQALLGSRQIITDPGLLTEAIEGFGGGGKISLVGGLEGEAGTWWAGKGGEGALVYSYGAQAEASIEVSATTLITQDPSLGWQWALDDQLGNTPWVRAITPEDIADISYSR